MWHRIENSLVVESTDVDPAGRFSPSLVWVADGGSHAQQGWSYVDGVFYPPSAISITAEQVKEAITAKRWQIETGGLTLHTGVHVATGIDDQNRITSVITNAELAGVEVVDFKAASGWVSVTVAELKAVAAAIALHVQQCFTAERMHHEAIDAIAAQYEADSAGLQAALQAYDTTQGWPTTDLREPQPA